MFTITQLLLHNSYDHHNPKEIMHIDIEIETVLASKDPFLLTESGFVC